MKHTITTLFLLLLLAVTGTAKAQNIPEKAHTWEKLPMENTAWVHFFRSAYDDSTYYQIGINGDTVINAVHYHKVYDCDRLGFPISGHCIGGIRQDNEGKCYFISLDPGGGSLGASMGALAFVLVEQDVEFVIYDFALSECDAFPYDGDSYLSGVYYEVFQIDEIEINGSVRRVLWFDDDCEQTPHWYKPRWIEGVGSNFGLLYSLQLEPTLMGVQYRLVEILQDGEKVYTAPEFVGIDYTSVSENASPNETVRLYPNPFTESGTLDFGQLNADELTIMTLDGRIVRKENVKGMSSFNIEKRDLDSGLYFYRLSGENLKTVVGKMCIK